MDLTGHHPEDARIEESYRINTALMGDLEELTDQANRNHQGARRAYVRGAFALIEAMTYRMKASALAIGRGRFEAGEVLMLEELEYTLGSDGSLQRRQARINTLKNVRFTLAMLVKASGIEWAPRYDGAGWQAVNRASETRNRLMHPRTLKALEVTDEQLGDANRAVLWFHSTLIKILVELSQRQAREQKREWVPFPGVAENAAFIEENVL